MESIVDVLIRNNTLGTMEIVRLQMTNKAMYIFLYERVNVLYKNYISSHAYKEHVIRRLNDTSRMIDAFVYNNRLLNKMLFEFTIACYENWHWLTMNEAYRMRLNFPQSPHFKSFLDERGLTIKDIIPKIQVMYTHFHRPSKSFAYYKTYC